MLIRSGRRKSRTSPSMHTHTQLTQENRKTDYELFYSCIREQITAVLHFLMESRTNVTVSEPWSRFSPIRWLYYSTPSVPKYSPRRLQLHNFIHPSQGSHGRFKLMLDVITSFARLFGISSIRSRLSSHGMGGHSGSKKGPLSQT
jgi:hypothetical protein